MAKLSPIPEPTEAEEQKSFVRWLRQNKILFTSVSNENVFSFLNRDVAIKIEAHSKAMGKQKGFPDILILAARDCWHGLLIEMKRIKSGSLTKEQRWWLETLIDHKYYAVCCRGKDHAIEITLEYLKGEL